MALVATDYPDQLAAAGLVVHRFDDWSTCGGSASHRAVVIHHTASSSTCTPSSDAAYCHHGSQDSPLYNVLVDRYGEAWVLAREKSNSSGSISSVARDEAHGGRAGCTSAGERGLGDDGSSNDSLFAIAAQSNGETEQWSDALIHGVVVASAVALRNLGLGDAGFVTQHRVLTARKIDPAGPGCPHDWQPAINDYLGGRSGPPRSNITEVGMIIVFGPNGAALTSPGYWQNLDGEGYGYYSQVPGIVVQSVDQRAWDVMRAAALHGTSADDEPLT